ncbi:hypothetical protein [Actinoplanes aureus]|uniref:Uncharacterized protein n=1 Tax=Actinoplanes aureus TaxID=2792083 RepID=A0A931CJ72_9ACTN|nr:hypothetical protein [Actinoplanes aureus]MBG0567386.1 hypothetical protein [Actinoplanes aureus]
MLLPTTGGTGDMDLAFHVRTWLQRKGFEAEEVLQQGSKTIVRAHEPTRWKRYIGASPSIEVRFHRLGHGTNVEIGLMKAGAAVIAARYFTYSWVAMGVSYVSLKKELQEFLLSLQGGNNPVGTADPRVLDIVETGRVERPVGTDTRKIDNSGSGSDVTRNIKASRRWTQSCGVEMESLRTRSGGVDFSVADFLSLKGSLETQVRKLYSISTEQEQTFEEEIGVTVPPHTALVVVMEWKRIAQQGRIRLTVPQRGIVELPFEIDLGITFDLRQYEQ